MALDGATRGRRRGAAGEAFPIPQPGADAAVAARAMAIEAGMEGRGVDRLLATLQSQPRVTLDNAALWLCFAGAFPRRPAGPDERRWLRLALTYAHAAGVITLPGEKSRLWDRTGTPALPRAVRVARPEAAPVDDSWRRLPWHPALQWVPELRTQLAGEIPFLRRVHEGLVQGAFTEVVPIRHRSLQLTGDEKRLEKLLGGSLFQPGRLSLSLLGCEPELPPLAWVTVGSSPRVIVFENSGPFDLATRVLQGMVDPPYGTVVYGAGMGFVTSVARLARLQVRPTEIAYVGDLDRNGLRIPTLASTQATAAGLPAPVAPPGLHQAMLDGACALGQPGGWATKGQEGDVTGPKVMEASDSSRMEVADEALLAFLPPDLRPMVQAMWAHGHRIPEEVLSPEALRHLWSGQAAVG